MKAHELTSAVRKSARIDTHEHAEKFGLDECYRRVADRERSALT